MSCISIDVHTLFPSCWFFLIFVLSLLVPIPYVPLGQLALIRRQDQYLVPSQFFYLFVFRFCLFVLGSNYDRTYLVNVVRCWLFCGWTKAGKVDEPI